MASTPEQRDAAMAHAIEMFKVGAANTTGSNTDDDLIRISKRIADFIADDTVPSGS